MKKYILILSILGNLILGGVLMKMSCKNTNPNFHPFDINFNVTEKTLLKLGYEWIPEDVPLLGKEIGDTLIYYQFDYECNEVKYKEELSISGTDTMMVSVPIDNIKCKNIDVIWRNCQIKLYKQDSLEIIKIIDKYGGLIISDWNMPFPSFDVKYMKNRMIFHCSVHRDETDDIVLGISCDYPKIN